MHPPTFSRNLPAELPPSAAEQAFSSLRIKLLPLQSLLLSIFQQPGDSTNVFGVPVIAASVPRQNGKTYAAELHALFCADVLGAHVLYTTHRAKTARGAFNELRTLCSIDRHPELAADVDMICRAAGHERISFRSSGAIDFATRSLAASRGESFNVVIIDEAQELTLGQQAAIAPTTLAAGTMRQTIFLGTPPGPETAGEVFQLMHDGAHDNSEDPGYCWLEWAAAADDNINDKTVWERCNPSFGPLITENAIAEMLAQMKPAAFRCEVLGYWAPLTSRVIHSFTPAEWQAATVESAPTILDQSWGFGVKTNSDGAFLAGALSGVAGLGFAEFIGEFSPTELPKLAAFLNVPKRRHVPVTVDGLLAQSVCLLLPKGKHPGKVRIATARDVARACVFFEGGTKGRAITHPPDNRLKLAAIAAAHRLIGASGGWGFKGDGAEMLEACALASAAAREAEPPRAPAKLI